MSGVYEYAFPAIRGVQAGRVYFVSMCPLKLLPKMFVWDDDDLPPELRAQRTLNRGRIPEIVRYIEENTASYTFFRHHRIGGCLGTVRAGASR